MMLTVSTVLSQGNLKKEEDSTCYSYKDNKIIAQTFNENSYLKQRVDSLESLQTIYKEDIDYYKQKDTLFQYNILLKDGVITTQSSAINKLSFNYNELLKENNKNKILIPTILGGLVISLGVTLYSILK